MNRITLTLEAALFSSKRLAQRIICHLTGQSHDSHVGPQWQQLELPFSRTPVKRWNR